MRELEEIKKMLEELQKRRSSSANMNYELAGAKEALEWVLGDRKNLTVGLR